MMATKQFFVYALFLLCFQHFSANLAVVAGHSILSENEKEFVEISVQYVRSAANSFDYRVQLTAFEQPINLQLRRPDSSIFAIGFTYGTSTIAKDKLADVEKNIFVDPKSVAAVSIQMNTRGSYNIQGFVNGTSISHDENGRHYVQRSVSTKEFDRDSCVAVKIDETTDQKMDKILEKGATIDADAVIEVQVVYDKAMAAAIGGTQQTITSYSAVMYHVVNIIYGSMVDPFLTVKLAGVNVLSDADDVTIVQNTGRIGGQVLSAFATWIRGSPAGLGPGDVVALVIQERFLDENGQPSNLAGIGYLGATCGSYKASATCDSGAIWAGVFTMAHEIGHNMGAIHDFDSNCGSEGYIMDYKRDTPNAYGSSQCSKQSIRDRINSASGNCLYTEDAGSGISLGNSDPGDIYSMEAQCEVLIRLGEWGEYTGFIPQADPAIACLKLTCKYTKPDGSNWAVTFNLPSEGTSCNQSGGRCRQGYCV